MGTATRDPQRACVFTLDVEDWFHILDLPSTPAIEQWPSLPTHVERNTRRMLAILRQYEVKATLFFLGWVAERWPQLVKEAVRDGHEIASHGYAHELVYSITHERFLSDIRMAKDIIEQASRPPACRCWAIVVRVSVSPSPRPGSSTP
jgi:peptidoglycan/xylan/chitin deacetylase (PgdA/CDA1 family)